MSASDKLGVFVIKLEEIGYSDLILAIANAQLNNTLLQVNILLQ